MGQYFLPDRMYPRSKTISSLKKTQLVQVATRPPFSLQMTNEMDVRTVRTSLTNTMQDLNVPRNHKFSASEYAPPLPAWLLPGEIVWAQHPNFPKWPGRNTEDDDDCSRYVDECYNIEEDTICVEYLQWRHEDEDLAIEWLPSQKVTIFKEEIVESIWSRIKRNRRADCIAIFSLFLMKK